ncbi:MAG: sulfatase family protein [Blastocatellia bacterium]
MRIRQVLFAACFIAVLAALAKAQPAAAAAKRPNILFLVADEYRHDCLGVAGHPIVKTPNFDRLAHEGVRFTQAYVASPVCSPSRATMFTGRYPQIHGVKGNNFPFNDGEVALPKLLRASGYTTGMVGKLHLQGHDDWFDSVIIDRAGDSANYEAFLRATKQLMEGNANTAAVPESLVGKGKTPLRIGTSVLPEESFPEAWEADRAIDFLRAQQGKGKPWFLYLSMLKPHSEFVIPAPFDKMYAAKDMPLPRTFKAGIDAPADFVTGGAAYGKDASKRHTEDGPGSRARLFINDADILREVIAHYYGAVSLVDKHMGRVLAILDELGMRDDTVVIFTADHGNMLGERNRMFKGVMYESSARVPLLFRAPGRIPAGRVNDAVFDNSTLMPTLLELAGLPVPSGVQGKSLAPLMRGNGPAPEAAFAYLSDKMVRQGDWKLIVPLARSRSGKSELYNVARDPDEQTNLYGKPEAANVQQKLTALMESWDRQQPPKVEMPKVK